jgi:hypothetical protein
MTREMCEGCGEHRYVVRFGPYAGRRCPACALDAQTSAQERLVKPYETKASLNIIDELMRSDGPAMVAGETPARPQLMTGHETAGPSVS